MERKLAAILSADVVGYSRLMEQNEAETFERLRAHRTELFEPAIDKHHGRVFKLMGDGLLAEFASVVDAVECAVALQRGMAERNNGVPAEQRIEVRIGVNLGDVIVEGEDRHGEGVNIAARLQELAEPGGIRVSGKVAQEVEKKLAFGFESMGEQHMKNIAEPVHVYRVLVDGTAARAPRRRYARRISRTRAMVAALAALVAVGGAVIWYLTRGDPVLALPSGSKIAILSFTNLSDDPDDISFSIGLTEDINTALTRFSNLFVFPRQSTKNFSTETDPRDIGREIGADFVLTGSIRRAADQLRVTARLFDAKDGAPIWSGVYNKKSTAADVFEVQDEITEQIVGIIASSDLLQFKKKKEELRNTRPDNLEDYECVLLSIWIYDDFKEENHAHARECLERTVERAPNYALAWAHLAQMYFEEYKYGWNARPDPIGRARDAVERALKINPQEQYARMIKAFLLYTCERGFEPYYAEAEAAIEINPNDSTVLADLGLWMIYSGEWERGRPFVAKASILNPRHPEWYYFAFFLDHYRKGEYDEALREQLNMNQPTNPGIQVGLAAVHGQLGETEKALAVVAAAPKFFEDPRAWFMRRRFSDELLEALMDGLRKAGIAVPPKSPSPPPSC